MKIMCSGGLQPEAVEHTACLHCALERKGRQPCGLSYPLLKALYKYENGEERRSAIHVTNLTTCLAKSWWEMVHPQAFYPHERLLVFLGKAVHQIIELSMLDDENFESEQPLEGFGVVGTADLVGQGVIIDAKTTRWLDPTKQLPYGSHQQQVNTYAVLYNQQLGEGGTPVETGQIQYIDMSGPTTCRRCRKAYRLQNGIPTCPSCGAANPKAHLGALIVEFPIDQGPEFAQWIQIRAGMLQDAIETGNPPEAEPGWICDYCAFTKYCPAMMGV